MANLEVKKLILGAKQELIGKAFVESIDSIRADKDGYKQLLLGMLEYATDGDTLTISKLDKAILTPKDVDEIAKQKNIKLLLNKEYGDFAGGIILSNAITDKNFTLEVELSTLRDEIEPEIAKKLFGEN